VFKSIDQDRDGLLNFEEFVICLWGFLSDELSHFAFSLFDKDHSHVLHRSEVIEMTKYVYGTEHGHNRTLDQTIDKMETDIDGNVTFEAFREHTKKNQSILFPAFVIQRTLRRAILGELFWTAAERKRMRNMPGLTVLEILNRSEQEVSDSQVNLRFADNM
jgi:hypothetical protein